MEIVNRNPSELIAAEYNPRTLSADQHETISDSLKRFGFVDPIIVNKHPDRMDIIIGGHQRTKVAKTLGIKEVPTVELSLDLAREKELNIRLNKNTGDFDMEALEEYFDVSDLIEWGFDEGELEWLADEEEPEVEEDDFYEEPPEEPQTELGRIYQLGEHRLMCGDSTSAEDVARLMDGEKADLGHTDPPYGIGYGGSMSLGQKKHGWTQYEGGWDEERPDPKWLDNIKSFSENLIVWGGNYFTDLLPPSMCWLIWDKAQREFTLADGEMAWTSFNNAMRMKTISRSAALQDGKVHPTQKPIELIVWCFDCAERNMKKKANVVIDLFGGSGSTLIAAEQTGRKCRMMELDPKYCDVIVRRYCKLKGIDPEEVFKTGVAQ